MRHIAIIGLICVVLSACTASYQQRNEYSAGGGWMDRSSSVYVSQPMDGRYGTINYHGSGQTVQSVVSSAFSRYLTRVSGGMRIESDFDEALLSAQDKGADYLVYPTILHWEDRNTVWSSIPDRVEISISIIDTATQDVVERRALKGRSAIVTLVGGTVSDLLPAPVNEFVAGVVK